LADEKNAALSDELMGQASGGGMDIDPYGYVCEGTVVRGPGKSNDRPVYNVEGDNGKGYWASWGYRSVLKAGDRVQVIHDDDGSYVLEPIPD
jgi:hypothetical protein